MSIPASFETLIEYIEALSPEDQVKLFNQIHSRRLEKQRQESTMKPLQTGEALQVGNAVCDLLGAREAKFWGEEGKATYHVLIANEPSGGVSATLLGWPECKAVGNSREDALLRLDDLVNARLATAEIVPVQIRSTQSVQSWVKLAAKLKDNPLFDEVLANMEAYRRELDAETEAYYRELDAQDQTK